MKIKYYLISIIGISLIVLLYFNISSNDIVNILTLTQTIIAFITLMIALIFYDRYNAGVKLNDKTLDIVIDYIEFLSKTTLLLEQHEYKNSKIEKCGFSIINFKSKVTLDKNLNYRLLVNAKSFIKFYATLSKYLNSPWMPKDIIKASLFLKPNDVNNLEHLNQIKENILILQICGNDFTNDDLMPLNNVINIVELEKNISNLMNTLNKWINKQAIKINFHI